VSWQFRGKALFMVGLTMFFFVPYFSKPLLSREHYVLLVLRSTFYIKSAFLIWLACELIFDSEEEINGVPKRSLACVLFEERREMVCQNNQHPRNLKEEEFPKE